MTAIEAPWAASLTTSGPSMREHGRVGAVLDRGDGAELLDDSGEHVSPQGSACATRRRGWRRSGSAGDGVDADVSPDDGDVDEVEAADVGDRTGCRGRRRRRGRRRAAPARRRHRRRRRDRRQEGRRERRAALEPDVADAPGATAGPGPRAGRASRGGRASPRRVVDPRSVGGTSRSPITDAEGLLRAERPHPASRTVSRGSSASDGAGADEHGVTGRPQPVDVGPRGLSRDPLAGAVGGGAATVEGRGELPRDERAAERDGAGPPLVERGGLVGQHPPVDLDAGGVQPLGAAGGVRVGVRLGEDDARHAGLDRARPSRGRCGPCASRARA